MNLLVKRLGQSLMWLVAAAMAIAAAGVVYQATGTSHDKRTVLPPGKLIDVGGYNLHLYCVGDGRPAVILEAMGDGTSVNWAWIQPEVGSITQTCAYDRAGRGWSEAGSQPRDAASIAGELHTLLTNAQIDPPFVMVGHSYGGLIVREYAAKYPPDVSGVVLIDGGQPDIRSDRYTELGGEINSSDQFMMSIAPLLARVGVFRMIGAGPDGLPEQQRTAYAAHYASSRLWDSMYEEQLKALPLTDQQVRQAGGLGEKPLMIINAEQPDDDNGRAFDELQIELLTLSKNSARHVVKGATHASLMFDQHDATETAAQITQVVGAARTGRPLDASPFDPSQR